MKPPVSMFALLIALACGSSAQAAEQPPLLAPLDDQARVQGCAWTASVPSLGSGLMFMAEYDDSQAWMNIDGSDVRLEVDPPRGSLQRVGDVIERAYHAPGIDVLARYTANWVCPADSEDACEVTRFGATFEVTTNDHIQIVDGIGEAGC